MKGGDEVLLAYVLGLGLMLGYAALLWNARRRAAKRSARVPSQDPDRGGREGSV